jgi:hypothetical protein
VSLKRYYQQELRYFRKQSGLPVSFKHEKKHSRQEISEQDGKVLEFTQWILRTSSTKSLNRTSHPKPLSRPVTARLHKPQPLNKIFNILTDDNHSSINAIVLHSATTALNHLVRTKQPLHTPSSKIYPSIGLDSRVASC